MKFYTRIVAAAITCAFMAAPAAFAQSTMSNGSTSSTQMAKPASGMMMAPHKKTHKKTKSAMSSDSMSNSSMSSGNVAPKTTAQ